MEFNEIWFISNIFNTETCWHCSHNSIYISIQFCKQHKNYVYYNLMKKISSFITTVWNVSFSQWRNRRGSGRAECPPETSDREISADLPGKRGKGKGVKIEKKRRKIVKGKVENWKWEKEESYKMRRGPFLLLLLLLLFFFFFFFLLLTFQNQKNLFWVYQNGNFLTGKSISRKEKIRKNGFAPSEKKKKKKKILLRPCIHFLQ